MVVHSPIRKQKHARANNSLKLSAMNIIGICVLVFIVFFSMQFYRGYKAVQVKQKVLLDLKEKVIASEVEYQRLVAMNEDVESQKYIERIAREQLGLVRKGEILIVPLE